MWPQIDMRISHFDNESHMLMSSKNCETNDYGHSFDLWATLH